MNDNSIIRSISYIVSTLREKYNFEKFHQVELFIYFYDYFTYSQEDKYYFLDKDSFVSANTSLLSLVKKLKAETEENFECYISMHLFNLINDSTHNLINDSTHNSKVVDLDNFVIYLKQLSDFDLDEFSLFRILDKAEKGYVTEKDADELLEAICEFSLHSEECNFTQDYLGEKKKEILQKTFTQKNLNEENLRLIFAQDNSILNLFIFFFKQAEDIIDEKINQKKNVRRPSGIADKNSNLNINMISIFNNGESFSVEEDNSRDDQNSNENLEKNSDVKFYNSDDCDDRIEAIDEYNPKKFRLDGDEVSLESGKEENNSFNAQVTRSDKVTNMSAQKIDNSGQYSNSNLSKQKNHSAKKETERDISSEDNSISNHSKHSEESREHVNVIHISQNDVDKTMENTHTTLYEDEEFLLKFFSDEDKLKLIDKLRIQSYLYDISVEEFKNQIFVLNRKKILLPFQKMNKKEFIDTFLNMINTLTSNLKIFTKTRALGELFDIVCSEDSPYDPTSEEVIGFITFLIKGSINEKIEFLFEILNFYNDLHCEKFYNQRFILMFSAIIRIGLSEDKSQFVDSKIIVEAMYEKFVDMIEKNNIYEPANNQISDDNDLNKNKVTSDDFKKWFDIIEESSENNKNLNPNLHESISLIVSTIVNELKEIKNLFNFERINLNEVIEIFTKHSLLGQINKSQFISAFDELLILIETQNCINLNKIQKNEKLCKIFSFLNPDNKITDTYELSEVITPMIIIHDSSIEDKCSFLYKLCDEEKEELSYSELIYSINQIFAFLIKINKNINQKIYYQMVPKLSNIVTDDIFSYFNLDNKGVITQMQMIEYFYNFE